MKQCPKWWDTSVHDMIRIIGPSIKSNGRRVCGRGGDFSPTSIKIGLSKISYKALCPYRFTCKHVTHMYFSFVGFDKSVKSPISCH